jgi:hypothetical protein
MGGWNGLGLQARQDVEQSSQSRLSGPPQNGLPLQEQRVSLSRWAALRAARSGSTLIGPANGTGGLQVMAARRPDGSRRVDRRVLLRDGYRR